MADTLIRDLETLREKIKALTGENARLRSRNQELERLNEALQMRTEEAESSRHRAELDIEYLTVSHRLASDPDSLIATRRRIAQLIRNIDRCLEMLKE